MAVLSLAQLLVKETKAAIYTKALSIATFVGLPVESWQAGDPTRSQYHHQSEIFETLEELASAWIASSFLDYASGIWLKIRAQQNYGVEVPDPTYATTDVVLTNNGGGLYENLEPGDVTFRSSTTGKTYHNTTTGTLAIGPATTLTMTVVADESGSASSAGAGEIDEIVTGDFIDVAVTNPTAAIGQDEQDPGVTVAQCRDKLGTLGNNGPRDAYSFILRTPKYSGLTYVPRVRQYSDSDTGDVRNVIAGPSGAVSAPDLATGLAALLRYSTPLCITPALDSAVNKVVAITYELWIYKRANKTGAQAQVLVDASLTAMFPRRPIGGDIIPPAQEGKLYVGLIEAAILAPFGDDAFKVVVTSPAADVDLENDEVAAKGVVTVTAVHVVVDP